MRKCKKVLTFIFNVLSYRQELAETQEEGDKKMVNTLSLKAKLKERGMTQEEAAKRLGIDPSTFNRKINNESGNVITVREAEALSRLLQIPKEDLVTIFFAEKLAETQAVEQKGA